LWYFKKIEIFKYVNSIREKMPGTTVVQKPYQGFSRSLGVLSCGGPFCLPAFGIQAGVPFWPNKKVRKQLWRLL
jgi:hypothetical protein